MEHFLKELLSQFCIIRSKWHIVFEDYQAFESAIELYQSAESVQFYKRDSKTVQKAKPSVPPPKKMAEPWIEPVTSSKVRYTTD